MRKLLLLIALVTTTANAQTPFDRSADNVLDAQISAQSPTLWLDPDSPVEVEPVVHFTMEDNAASTAVSDKSGNYAGTAIRNTNTTFGTASGKITRGFDFNSDSLGTDRIDAGTIVINGDFTYAVWLNPDNLGEANQGRIISSVSDNVAAYLTTDGATGWLIKIQAGSVLTSPTISTTFDGAWRHIVWRRLGGVSTLWVNGAVVLTGDAGSTGPSSNFYIGNNSGQSRTFDGRMDDARLYDRAITETEIKNLYYNGTGHQNQAASVTQGAVVVDAANRVGAWQSRVGGIEFTQQTDANKPVLTRGDDLENRMAYSDDPTQSVWNKVRATYAGGILVEDGTLANTHYLQQNSFVITSGVRYRIRARVKYKERHASIRFDASAGFDSGYAHFNLQTGAVNSTTLAVGNATITPDTNGYYIISAEETASASGTNGVPSIYMADTPGNVAYNGNNASGVYVDWVEFSAASTAQNHLKNTLAGPQYAGINGRRVVRFDGNDDYLSSAATQGDIWGNKTKYFSLVTVPFLINSTQEIFDGSAGSHAFLRMNSTGGKFAFGNVDAAGAAYADGATATAGKPHVVTVVHDGASISARSNANTNAYVSSGATTAMTETLRLGAWGSGSNPYAGLIGPVIAKNTVVRRQAFEPIERGLADKYGASLAGSLAEQDCETYIRSLTPTMWLDASDMSTITKDGSNKVSAWTSRVASPAISFTQGTGANQPTWTGAGVDFDGAASGMTSTSLTSDIFANNGKTFFFVGNCDTFTAADVVAGDASVYWNLGVNATPKLEFLNYVAANTTCTSALPSVSTNFIWEGTHDGVNIQSWTNGASDGAVASGNTGNMTKTLRLGSANASTLDCRVMSFITFNAAKTADQRARVRSCLASKYGVSF